MCCSVQSVFGKSFKWRTLMQVISCFRAFGVHIWTSALTKLSIGWINCFGSPIPRCSNLPRAKRCGLITLSNLFVNHILHCADSVQKPKCILSFFLLWIAAIKSALITLAHKVIHVQRSHFQKSSLVKSCLANLHASRQSNETKRGCH